jgi:Flp pilus assembly secretin CpaC
LDNKKRKTRKEVQAHVHLPDATAATEAAELISQFGEHAAFEAAARANHSRGLGNVVHFCRWRQIERMINLLTAEDPGEITIH